MNKIGIEKCIEAAKNRNGFCLDGVFINSKHKMRWTCKCGKIFTRSYSNYINGMGLCKTCNCVESNISKKLTIEDCRALAKQNNGECISDTYINNRIKLKWRCENKHEWECNINNIKQGKSWCPHCAKDKFRSPFKDCINIAKIKGGECLSSKNDYKNYKSLLKWRCKQGHEWSSSRENVINRDTWCPECSVVISALKSSRTQNIHNIKFHWQTNEELVCQGSWEAKVVDYLNANQINYKWQPKTFTLSTGKTYRPDLYLVDTDTWVEIKGYFRDDAKEKWDEFTSVHPNSELWDKKKLKGLNIL